MSLTNGDNLKKIYREDFARAKRDLAVNLDVSQQEKLNFLNFGSIDFYNFLRVSCTGLGRLVVKISKKSIEGNFGSKKLGKCQIFQKIQISIFRLWLDRFPSFFHKWQIQSSATRGNFLERIYRENLMKRGSKNAPLPAHSSSRHGQSALQFSILGVFPAIRIRIHAKITPSPPHFPQNSPLSLRLSCVWWPLKGPFGYDGHETV